MEQNKEVDTFVVFKIPEEVMTQKQIADISEETTPIENQVPKNIRSKKNIENKEILVSYVVTRKR